MSNQQYALQGTLIYPALDQYLSKTKQYCMFKLKLLLLWNFFYQDHFYLGTSIVSTAQINCMVCSLQTVNWLDKSTRRGSKGCCCLLVGWLVYYTTNSYHWLLSDKTFYNPGEGSLMHCSDFLFSYPLTAQHQLIAINMQHYWYSA